MKQGIRLLKIYNFNMKIKTIIRNKVLAAVKQLEKKVTWQWLGSFIIRLWLGQAVLKSLVQLYDGGWDGLAILFTDSELLSVLGLIHHFWEKRDDEWFYKKYPWATRREPEKWYKRTVYVEFLDESFYMPDVIFKCIVALIAFLIIFVAYLHDKRAEKKAKQAKKNPKNN